MAAQLPSCFVHVHDASGASGRVGAPPRSVVQVYLGREHHSSAAHVSAKPHGSRRWPAPPPPSAAVHSHSSPLVLLVQVQVLASLPPSSLTSSQPGATAYAKAMP